MKRPFRELLVLLIAIALLAAGCGVRHDVAEDGPPVGGDSVRSLAAAQTDPRQVVYTADLTVRVGEVARAVTDAVRVATDANGVVFAQSSDLQGRKEARLTLKVPPERFESVLADLARIGRALKREVKAQDVTEEVTDVEGRLRTAQASAERLRTLLGAATSTADVVAVEGELAKRESDIESLQGRVRVLTNQVELATIRVSLTESAELEVSAEVPGFLKALRAGWVALLNVILAAVAVGGFVLPFAPLGVLGGWVVRRRRLRRSLSRDVAGASG
jgi:hypothetical protein